MSTSAEKLKVVSVETKGSMCCK